MYSEMPLHTGWTLEADELPERLIHKEPHAEFSLPGADALADFSALLGFDAAQEEASEDTPAPVAPFTLPAMLPPDVCGRAVLSREIDFSSLCARHAALEIDHLCGRGSITLDGVSLASFGSGAPSISVDLTDAMRLGRGQTLSICFDDAKDAGVCGAVLLRTSGAARFESVALSPSAAGRTICAAITLHAEKPGVYAVRAAVVPSDSESPWSETRLSVNRAGEAQLNRSFSLRAPRFEPGKPYSAPVIKLELYALLNQDASRGTLLDVRTLMTGFPGAAPRSYIPLTKDECRVNPEELIAHAKAIGVPALFLPAPASGLLYRRAAQEGVALLPYAPGAAQLPEYAANSPGALPIGAPDPQTFGAFFPAAACYQLSASPSAPACDPGIPEDELLLDAAGRRIDPDDPATKDTLKTLQALAVRLRAEAARQGQYAGSLCAPAQWQEPMFFDAIRCAFAPLHMSVLPLRGAWWTQSHFSAAIHVFIPEAERAGIYTAQADLVGCDGSVLAAFSQDCPVQGGTVGFISALLPDTPCTLTLRTRLLRSGAVAETQEIPVYVGLRGPLEEAFAR